MMRALSEKSFGVEPTSPGLIPRRILMPNRTFVVVALCLACACALVACGGGAEGGGGGGAAAERIGIAECDDYLEKLASCVANRMPEEARAQYRSNLETTRKAWRDLAADPQKRGTLTTACKQAAESARAAYKGFGCEF